MRHRHWQQRGDTLVEVVISLAILSVTLVTAFNIANNSYNEGLSAREHTQAIYLAQEQAEKLYLYRDNLIAAAVTADNPSGVMNPVNFGGCDTSCYFGPTNTTPQTAGSYYKPALFNGITYYVSITPLNGAPLYNVANDEGQFKITVTWNSAISTGVHAASGTNENTTTLNLILVDNRGITPRDCSVAGSVACS